LDANCRKKEVLMRWSYKAAREKTTVAEPTIEASKIEADYGDSGRGGGSRRKRRAIAKK
ncbi:hypothetical protein BHM03_00063126, partial [Ensete ventricosum]